MADVKKERHLMRWILIPLLVLCAAFHSEAAVVGEPVEYTAGDVTLKGYLAYDDAADGPRPGILVVHEWWGHNEYARRRARMLAEMGYTALAVDMYGDGKVAGHPDDAGKFAGEVKKNMGSARGRFEAALRLLQAHATTDAGRTAAIGYCFGGGVVLQMAREGVDLDAVVSFHGSLSTDQSAAPGAVKARVLVCHGAADAFVPQAEIEAFKAEMAAAGADMKFVAYPGAKHSFTNPEADTVAEQFGLNIAYHPEADQQSWQDMQAFLKDVFAPEPAKE
jgi:dienelactone hydrolase